MNFIDELRWRGMVHNITPGLEKLLDKEMVTAYIGVDPTAPSLTVGNLAALMIIMHFQRAGHKPILLAGGATGRVGDPSGKKAERTLLSLDTLEKNIAKVKQQFSNLLNFDESAPNHAIIVNNYDWYKDMPVLDFLRDIGKHLTVNYMLSKDSVKTRLETGISFTEFSYQLIQGYDFKYLYETYNCKLQVGGSDQWGNITAGTELIRRMIQGEAYAVTCPLITKADGTKFGKSTDGNIWLDPDMTSPYKFYQFWLNASDDDVKKFIRIFTFLTKEEVESLEAEHEQNAGARILQKRLAQEITSMIHGEVAYQKAVEASTILFGKGKKTKEILAALSERELLELLEGVPQFMVNAELLQGDGSVGIINFLAEHTNIYASKGEARRALKNNSVAINKEKVNDQYQISTGDLLNNKYILVQKGKKNYNLVILG